ncbi:hypothetical protein E4T56_gene2775 [Termitomyces sp. T112]|nr:hypothetical protein E4T56_gene2775 [Termitomyces sp. T112]
MPRILGPLMQWGIHNWERGFDSPTHIQLTLPASKIDPFRKGITITVAAAPGRCTCPVAALKALFTKLPRGDNTPLFEQPDGINSEPYAGHSFRQGVALAAAAAAAAGYYDYEIQMLGRWRSDSYKLMQSIWVLPVELFDEPWGIPSTSPYIVVAGINDYPGFLPPCTPC